MLWFSNRTASPAQFTGIHCGPRDGAYVVILVHPDGSQETKTFADEEAMYDGALKIHCALVDRGWRHCPEPQPQTRAF